MVGPTPIVAPYRLSLEYSDGTATHTRHEFCDAVVDGAMTSGYAIIANDASNVDPSIFATAIADAAKALYNNTFTFGVWTLQKYLSGIYATVASGSISVAGTGTGTIQFATQVAVFARDVDRVAARIIFYETLFGVPFKNPFTTSNAALAALATSYSAAAGVFVGNYARTRNNKRMISFLSFVGTDNRRLRKLRGLI